MTRMAYDLDLFYPVSQDGDWFLRSLSRQHNELAACYAWFLAECTALAEDLHSELHHRNGQAMTVAEFIELSRIRVPISRRWNRYLILDENRLKEVLRTVGFVADNIDISVVKVKVKLRSRHFFDVTFTVRR